MGFFSLILAFPWTPGTASEGLIGGKIIRKIKENHKKNKGTLKDFLEIFPNNFRGIFRKRPLKAIENHKRGREVPNILLYPPPESPIPFPDSQVSLSTPGLFHTLDIYTERDNAKQLRVPYPNVAQGGLDLRIRAFQRVFKVLKGLSQDRIPGFPIGFDD